MRPAEGNGLTATVNSISIHAPQWGATNRQSSGGGRRVISIHAPQWGATRQPARRASSTRFQSTHPSGVRPVDDHRCHHVGQISIHAPQWGATPAQPSTPPANTFQSTHPSGVRQTILPCRTVASNFNPRTPVGCDMKNLNNDPSRNVFQSTHPSGVRQTFEAHGVQGLSISIHAPQWGATMPLEAAALAY